MIEEKILKDAQYRKGLSIAFFNATNAAIELCKNKEVSDKEMRKMIVEARNWLLEEHKTYYAEVIANVGKLYDVQETIKKLKVANNLEELKSIWMLLSEDERRDDKIIKVKELFKKSYEKS